MKILAMLVILSLGLLAGCGKQDALGQAIPSTVPVVKLKDILSDPRAYKDREVVLEGKYGAYCCPDDFSYKEGLEGIEIVPNGFASPKVQPGQPIRVYGVVQVKEERGDVEETPAQDAIEEPHDVVIAAKGVVFK